jgi:muramidase (phage lysozyme)
MPNREELEAVLNNPNVQRYLTMLSQAEGTAKYNDPYRTAFGGRQIADLSKHPATAQPFTQTDGKKNMTTAAGKYQFLNRTWNDVANTLGLKDFSAGNQDLGALELMRRSGSLNDVLRGDFASAVARDGKTWASLPSSPYAQPKRSTEFVNQALGNTTAAPQAVPQYAEENLSHALANYGISNESESPEYEQDSSLLSKVEHEGERAATRQYEQYGEEPRSEADKVIRMQEGWNNYAAWVENYIRELVDHV